VVKSIVSFEVSTYAYLNYKSSVLHCVCVCVCLRVCLYLCGCNNKLQVVVSCCRRLLINAEFVVCGCRLRFSAIVAMRFGQSSLANKSNSNCSNNSKNNNNNNNNSNGNNNSSNQNRCALAT